MTHIPLQSENLFELRDTSKEVIILVTSIGLQALKVKIEQAQMQAIPDVNSMFCPSNCALVYVVVKN